ncbi:sortase-associated OmpA-like protein PdsO [Shewanella psychrotolerans]|uniref:sortase-associated OmpA-like protein PdsO n=1 Tax=Shewanella psychrotolerans TaxID=2864206 RepID=UPI001C65F348|nr:sortase-associated OmpA-like protein PdsO [Shewanella psychrotolerans]QYK03005.1 sortase-associated OmpA-like protein PdsO [Shewanella psychrotolerans]
MKKQILAALISTTLLTSSMSYAASVQGQEVASEPSDKEALIGVGSGIVLGAVVGGPVGAIIGAFTGGMIGQSVADDSEIKFQQAQLAQQESEIAMLNQEKQHFESLNEQYVSAQRELEGLKQRQGARLEELALGLNVQFKTGSSEVESHFKEQLNEVADVMAMSPELKLDLTGYADRRGESSYNQALSEQRVAEVRRYLVKQGVNESRLDAKAFGATAPVKDEQSFENDFFDRRVTIKLLPADTAIAAN